MNVRSLRLPDVTVFNAPSTNNGLSYKYIPKEYRMSCIHIAISLNIHHKINSYLDLYIRYQYIAKSTNKAMEKINAIIAKRSIFGFSLAGKRAKSIKARIFDEWLECWNQMSIMDNDETFKANRRSYDITEEVHYNNLIRYKRNLNKPKPAYKQIIEIVKTESK